MAKPIGVGLLGTGFMGKCHALAWNAVKPTYGDIPDIRLVHLGEADHTLAERRACEFGFERASGDWRKVVADPDVDVISITTPNRFHAEMAIAALEAGKHVWCEKPMATSEADAERMRAVAASSGSVVLLGYNYIQNPIIRQIGRLLEEGTIGPVNHLRVEMDEDFMADATAPFGWRSEAAAGYGALDDFAVHPLSILLTLGFRVVRVFCDMAKPYADRPDVAGTRRAVETHDIANALLRLEGGATGTLAVNRAAWGRKGRIALQIFGAEGSLLYDQESMNEFRLYKAGEPAGTAGFRTVLAGPQHEPYGRFVPAPGHGLGFNDLKIIECRQLIGRILGEKGTVGIDFEEGFRIERTVHAMARSHAEQRWIDIG